MGVRATETRMSSATQVRWSASFGMTIMTRGCTRLPTRIYKIDRFQARSSAANIRESCIRLAWHASAAKIGALRFTPMIKRVPALGQPQASAYQNWKAFPACDFWLCAMLTPIGRTNGPSTLALGRLRRRKM